MKKRMILSVFLLMAAMLLVYAAEKKDEQKLPEEVETLESFSCIAYVPASASVGQSVQFLGNASASNGGYVVATDNIVGVMRYVPASTPGDFYIGSHDLEPGRTVDEELHIGQLTRNLATMEIEVTRQMWADLKAVQTDLPNDPTNTSYGNGMTNPVQNVTWKEAVLFANLLSIQNGFTVCYYVNSTKSQAIGIGNYNNDGFYCDFTAAGYRLPTEQEWEYFCRAGTLTPFFIVENNYGADTFYLCTQGVLPDLETAAIFCANANGGTGTTGSKLYNPWNVKDVHGNVSEWCWDWYDDYPDYYLYDYQGAASGTSRVIRGGSWGSNARYCRSANRSSATPITRSYYTGFRLVRTL